MRSAVVIQATAIVLALGCGERRVVAQETADTPAPTAVAAPLAGLTFGATLEGFYQWNGNEPFDGVTPLRAYDTRANAFGLQQATLVIESTPNVASGRRLGGRLDLQFGQATATVQGSSLNEPRPDVYRHVWQAYGSYVLPIGRGLQADFGKFASSLGYETNYAKDNHHFSRAYLFNFLPFYHMGVRATLPVADALTVGYGLTNGVQQTEDFNTFKSHLVTAVVTPRRGFTWTVNYYSGQEQPADAEGVTPDGRFTVLDSYVNWVATPRLSLALDVNRTRNEVWRNDAGLRLFGLGAYARYQLTGADALAIRYERLDDEGLFAPFDQVLQETTLTYERNVTAGFLVRGEYRRDWSSRAFFTSATPGRPSRGQHTATAGLVWWFGNKSGTW